MRTFISLLLIIAFAGMAVVPNTEAQTEAERRRAILEGIMRMSPEVDPRGVMQLRQQRPSRDPAAVMQFQQERAAPDPNAVMQHEADHRRAIIEGVIRAFIEPHLEDGIMQLAPRADPRGVMQLQPERPSIDPSAVLQLREGWLLWDPNVMRQLMPLPTEEEPEYYIMPLGTPEDREPEVYIMPLETPEDREPEVHIMPLGTPEDREFLSALNGFSADAARLVQDIAEEARRYPSLRPILSEARQVQSTVEDLKRQMQAGADRAALIETAETLAQQWRNLAQRLRQAGELDRLTAARVQRMIDNAEAILASLKAEPPLNKMQIVSRMITHSTFLAALLEDIELDVSDPNVRSEILLEGRALLAASNQMAEGLLAGSTVEPEALKARYAELFHAWASFKAKTLPFAGESMTRNVHRIDRLHQELHELFRLTV